MESNRVNMIMQSQCFKKMLVTSDLPLLRIIARGGTANGAVDGRSFEAVKQFVSRALESAEE